MIHASGEDYLGLCWFFKRITVLSALLMLHGVLEFQKPV